jgi:flagellin-like hook-associated protein FlgL
MSITFGGLQAAGTAPAQARVYDRVQTTREAATSTADSRTTELSQIRDIDLADMAVQLTTANAVYQSALQTTASIRQLSLMDFLR